LLLLAALLTMATASSLWLLGAALFTFGGSMGVLDVILNIQGLSVENRATRSMMSNFHGMFSLGTIAGSLLMITLLTLGLSPMFSTLTLLSTVFLLSVFAVRGYLNERTLSSKDAFVWP